MFELIDPSPQVQVDPAEYARLLGYPRGHVLEGRARELAGWVRAWYAAHARPWVYARAAERVEVINGSVLIDGVSFTSSRLGQMLHDSEAHGAILVAVSAGAELEAEARRAWEQHRPDEYFFLESYGAAVVEHLVTTTGARLCGWAGTAGLAVLPHYSPGYSQWDVSQQPRLLELIKSNWTQRMRLELDALPSGMLRPKKSLLAVFGLTRQVERVRQRLTELVPCQSCSFGPCQFRRAPYRGVPDFSRPEIPLPQVPPAAASPLRRDARYITPTNALARWAQQRLSLSDLPDGTIRAQFVYEGTTCTNMGRKFKFHYEVRLGPAEQGYLILQQRCLPAPGDEGHRFMCRYLEDGQRLLDAIAQDQPLLGQPLDAALNWRRELDAAGCYCEPSRRLHKWGLVLETIHYALVQRSAGTESRHSATEIRTTES
jgi:hypothetical protein